MKFLRWTLDLQTPSRFISGPSLSSCFFICLSLCHSTPMLHSQSINYSTLTLCYCRSFSVPLVRLFASICLLAIIVGCSAAKVAIKEESSSQPQRVAFKSSMAELRLVTVDGTHQQIHGYLDCTYEASRGSEYLSVTVKVSSSCPVQIQYDFATSSWKQSSGANI